MLRDIRFALLEAGTIAGSVRDERGLPVVGAVVEAAGMRARTDNAGRFRLDGVPVGSTEVWARGAGGTATP